MKMMNYDPSYELHLKGLEVKEGIKKQARQIVMDIKRWAGSQADIKVTIEPEAKKKKIFAVAVSVDGLESPISIKKHGRNIVSTLKKVKRIALRRLNKNQTKKLRHRRIKEIGRPMAS